MLKNAGRQALRIQKRGVGFKNVTIKNLAAEIYPETGHDVAKKPVKVKLEANKQYSWCNCGFSNQQPFCDGSHKLLGRTYLRPIVFEVDQTGEYSLCMCKQTDKRPICDGSHKRPSSKLSPDEANTSSAMGTYNSPVYEGVASKLGYVSKKGFQKV